MVFDKDKDDAVFLSEENKQSVEQKRASNRRGPGIQVVKSVQSKNQRSNPIAVWRVGIHKINAFAFSSNGQRLAVVAEDGSLRILDYMNEK